MARVAAAVFVGLVVAAAFAAAEGEPTTHYAEAEGIAVVGLLGEAVPVVTKSTVSFVPNASWPRLQLLLDYEPPEAGAEVGPLDAALAYEFHLDLRDNTTGETLASFLYIAPGTRWFDLEAERVDGRTIHADVTLRLGAAVAWHLNVYGWRAPIPI